MKRVLGVALVLSLTVWPLIVRPAAAAFPGNNGRIAYEEFVGGGIEIFTMNADGSHRGPVTSTPNSYEQNPSWSPDGSKILFNAYGVDDSEVEVINPDGTGRQQLTDTQRDEYSPVFSPDASKIAFVRYADTGDADVWTMNADGSAAERLTDEGDVTSGIDWRSDGAAIVFSAIAPGGTFALYQVDVATGVSTQLTTPSGDEDDFNPEYSPDGASVVFIRYANQAFPIAIDVDGTNERELDHVSPSIGGTAWAPEGNLIAVAELADPSAITLVSPDGSPSRTVIAPENTGELSWQPCTEDCAETGVRDSVTEVFDAYRKTKRKTAVGATVAPTAIGEVVGFTIYKKKDGAFRKIHTADAEIDEFGTAEVAFRVSKKGRCKATAKFEGNSENGPSTDTLRFPCKGFFIG
jgi:TolB protein